MDNKVSDVYNLLNEQKYGDEKTYISWNLKRFVENSQDVILVILDGAKKGSPIDECMKEWPDRVWDSGIAEQDMIGISAGAALAGKRVFCQSYGPFLTLRALEQIYLDIAYNQSKVCMIVTSAGLSAGEGPTHNTVMDIAVLRCIPQMIVLAPCDSNQMIKLMETYMSTPQPMYIRCSKANEPLIYKNESETFEIGKAKVLKEGTDIIILATGVGVKYSLEAAQILDKENISVGVIDEFTLKPLDVDSIYQTLKITNKIITVEDHGIAGGLGTIVAEIIAESSISCEFKRIGVPDVFTINGNETQLYEYYGMNADGIMKVCREMMG